MSIEEKRKLRFVQSIIKRAILEFDQLHDILFTLPGMEYFCHILESVFVNNKPEDVLAGKGKINPVIGVYCMVVPEELIYAAGAIPIRLCSGYFEAARLGEDMIPRDGCPLIKSSMGFSMQKGISVFDLCDVVIIPTTCDAKRKFGEELSEFKEVWMLETPHGKDTQSSRTAWIDQVYALKNKLEAFMGEKGIKTKINRKNLGKAIQDHALAQREIRRLLDFRKRSIPVIWGIQAAIVMNSFAYAPVSDWTRALVKLNNNLDENLNKGNNICSKNRPRIFIIGSPIIFPNLKIPLLIEEMGGIAVLDESCTGDRYLYNPVNNSEKTIRNQIESIAARYLAPCVCPSFSPNHDRLTLIKRMVSEFNVDGVLYHVLKGCVVYDFEVRRVEKSLAKEKIPMLRVETDYNPEDIEQIRTRIEAFMEILKTKKTKKVLEHS